MECVDIVVSLGFRSNSIHVAPAIENREFPLGPSFNHMVQLKWFPLQLLKTDVHQECLTNEHVKIIRQPWRQTTHSTIHNTVDHVLTYKQSVAVPVYPGLLSERGVDGTPALDAGSFYAAESLQLHFNHR